MKTLLAFSAVLLITAGSSEAQIVRGYYRGNGAYVMPQSCTPANDISYDNVSSKSRNYTPVTLPNFGRRHNLRCYSTPVSIFGSTTRIGSSTFHDYFTSDGRMIYGTTTTIGNTSFTDIYAW